MTENEETILNPDYKGFVKMSWSKFDVTRSEKSRNKCNSTFALICLFAISGILIAASVACYYVVRVRVQNGISQGIILIAILAVTSTIHTLFLQWLLQVANMKYLNQKLNTFVINKMAFEFINFNLPIVYALSQVEESSI